ncbi:hypothetical protein K438DRAFT_1983586 [Mycena galopus ATCC 62051]|nr:hypothetical protein K438DRAFT_1983586 [Mycena galopus ATCC 62051]
MALAPGTKESYIGALVENILYGLYLSAFVECRSLFWRKSWGDVKHLYLMTTAALMFILITMRCIIDTYRCIVAFDGPELDFGPPNSTPGNITNLCLILVIAIADMFMIFRTFIVWNRRWVFIILPVLLFIVNFAMGIWTITAAIRVGTSNVAAIASVLQETITIFITLTLATNVVCTGLIAFRIIHVHLQLAWMGPRIRGDGRSQSLKILSVLVESAAIYTLLLIPTLICARLGSFAVFILLQMSAPTIGLVFSHIILAVIRGTSYGDTTTNSTTTSSSDFRARLRRNNDTLDFGRSSTRSATRPEVHVQLEQTIEPQGASRNDAFHRVKYSPV